MTYGIPFRIRRKYFDLIIAGCKIREYRPDSPFWRRWLENMVKKGYAVKHSETYYEFPGTGDKAAIGYFVCGKLQFKIRARAATLIDTPPYFSDQGKADVSTASCWAFHLDHCSQCVRAPYCSCAHKNDNCIFRPQTLEDHKTGSYPNRASCTASFEDDRLTGPNKIKHVPGAEIKLPTTVPVGKTVWTDGEKLYEDKVIK